eukprot:augustus_masked-scaffold_47-processed-gene-1.33-mRNA-1 protein AED:1.00 eAED:1.00 QI:0/0/0/0/1/1/4/0/331
MVAKVSKQLESLSTMLAEMANEQRKQEVPSPLQIWCIVGLKFKRLKSKNVEEVRELMEIYDAYAKLKRELSGDGVAKEGLIDSARKYIDNHDTSDGEDTLRLIQEEFKWPKDLKENSQRCDLLKFLNAFLSNNLRIMDERFKFKLEMVNPPWLKSLDAFHDIERKNAGVGKEVAPKECVLRRREKRRKNLQSSVNSAPGKGSMQDESATSFSTAVDTGGTAKIAARGYGNLTCRRSSQQRGGHSFVPLLAAPKLEKSKKQQKTSGRRFARTTSNGGVPWQENVPGGGGWFSGFRSHTTQERALGQLCLPCKTQRVSNLRVAPPKKKGNGGA